MAKRGLPPDLKSQIGSFLRTTWQQLDTVRGVVVQKSREGRIQLDLTLLRRKRKDALAELGNVVARLARSGKIDEEKYPDLSAPLSRLEALDERIEQEEQRARHASQGIEDPPMGSYAEEEYDEEDVDDSEPSAEIPSDEKDEDDEQDREPRPPRGGKRP
jgi:hypothetical protein